ncbi:fructose-bisphosphate aldolase class I [Candidatus Saccharibacteria bacterium]|nr:fructose-bisphosphate aldolase class I [Candidatus Saccharibacteria bacterium]
MNILVVGNVTKDVYLNLDSRTENFETDKFGTKWLDFSFNASEHRFFHRESSLGGAAVSLEVLQKFGIDAAISGSTLSFKDDNPTADTATHRYILVSDGDVSYLSPTNFTKTTFTPPSQPADYLYLDRSATLTAKTTEAIQNYLKNSPNTKLVIYLREPNNHHLNSLLEKADLIFAEISNAPALDTIDPNKIIHISAEALSYADVSETISVNRINVATHLSTYSIAAATILASFVLGHSVEISLQFARLNIEKSLLNSTLSLPQLQELATSFTAKNNLELIAKNLVLYPKGILAADESGGSIHKKFGQLDIPDTYQNRRNYRNLFFTTKDLEKYINGVILFDETARQLADNGQNFVDYLTGKRLIPGIKVDQGLAPIEAADPKTPDYTETYTKGLVGLDARLAEYYQMGLRFAKWRAAFEIHLDDHGNPLTPTDYAIIENCTRLAEYAEKCQSAGLVPIVEPEVVYDGFYDIHQCAEATAKILDCLFAKLKERHVNLRGCLLKCNMVLAGKQQEHQSTPEEVAKATAKVLKNHVPKELAGVVFLSGGQTVEQATANLAAIIKNGPFPWPVTFSFARALQDPALYAWAGYNQNAEKARQAFLDRLIANTKALQ